MGGQASGLLSQLTWLWQPWSPVLSWAVEGERQMDGSRGGAASMTRGIARVCPKCPTLQTIAHIPNKYIPNFSKEIPHLKLFSWIL